MTRERMVASSLNRHLASPLRIEIVTVETTQARGTVNVTELAGAVATRLAELERLPASELPVESRWERDGLLLVWRARARTAAEANDPVVVEPI
jgi:hypothetical protein